MNHKLLSILAVICLIVGSDLCAMEKPIWYAHNTPAASTPAPPILKRRNVPAPLEICLPETFKLVDPFLNNSSFIPTLVADVRKIEADRNPVRRAKTTLTAYYNECHYKLPILQAAILTRSSNALKALIKANAPVVEDYQGKYPLDYALENNYTQEISLLLNGEKTRTISPKILNECSLDAFKHLYTQAKNIIPPKTNFDWWINIHRGAIPYPSQDNIRIQLLIDNDLLCIPAPSIQDMNNATLNQKMEKDVFALEELIALASRSKISISDDFRLKAQQYILTYYAHDYACDGGFLRFRNTLTQFKVPLPNTDIKLAVYARALCNKDATVLDALNKNDPLDLQAEWNIALEIMREIQASDNPQPQDVKRFIHRAYVSLTLNPDLAMNEATADAIHQTVRQYQGRDERHMSASILTYVSGYTSENYKSPSKRQKN